MESVGTARLTEEIPAPRAVAASVSRRAITDVLHADGTPELTLEVVAPDRGDRGTISMTWSREDLERLLEAASGDEVVLTFDRDELASAFGDVEAHGLRTRAAVFAVAAAGALGSGVTAANAMLAGGDGGGTAGTPVEATSTAGATDALQARSEAMNQQYGLGSAGDTAAVRALQERGSAMNATYGLGDEATASRVTDVSSAGGYGPAPTASSGGIGFQSPTTDDALLAAGLLLTIAGATFAVRRTTSPRPA